MTPIQTAPAGNAEILLAELDAWIEGEGAPISEAGAPKSPKILLVDDNHEFREIARGLLERTGCEVIEAVNGVEGLRRAVAERPDLVLIDFNMPLMNGYELLLELRRDFELRKVPIIMVAGKGSLGFLKELPLYVSRFLEKPVPNDRLLEAVHGALGRASPLRAGRHEIVLEPRPLKPASRPAAGVLEGLQEAGDVLIDAESTDEERASELELEARDSPLINHVNRILLSAVQLGASDIHIEPQEREIRVRVRVNGTLGSLCTLPAAIGARLCARVKIISGLIITERRRPQDGQFRITVHGRRIEFRVSTLPGIHGEKVVMRILGAAALRMSPSEIGFDPRELECVEKSLQSQHGLILVTGPTGSGKTTTLYSMIARLNNPGVNIMTAEDPVEHQIHGITQVHIKPSLGLTFEAALRSFLRQDPDVMLIGEIRDLETAEIAVKASITGHLVLSTLHTNSAPATLTRLKHMGIKPYLAAASVRLVIAQRLVRLLCPNCKLKTPLSEAEKRALTDEESADMRGLYRGVGCSACGQTGYSGRKAVFEVMPVTSAVRQLILSSDDAAAMAQLAVKEGMTSLRRSALALASAGETSLTEALKIVLSE